MSHHGGVLVGPDQLRQVFTDTDTEALWLIIGALEELEFLQGSKSQMDLSLIYPTDPTQLPKKLAGAGQPPMHYPPARAKAEKIQVSVLFEVSRSL